MNWELQDHYKVLELKCDASDDEIRSNFIRLALKWHPDKLKETDSATSRFQEINEAYQVLSDPFTRHEYDKKRMRHIHEHNMVVERVNFHSRAVTFKASSLMNCPHCLLQELFNRYKELILTCNGLGMKNFLW
ncbi:unnamed protein product [Arabis nemorensis]|uniref:J domain-containing protein n=1 Tax=Arabis nemorensis TaxID=586526 RepID=A0A565BK55_9BRAS|nr:unnamed protein product [Arabis nemorensis]